MFFIVRFHHQLVVVEASIIGLVLLGTKDAFLYCVIKKSSKNSWTRLPLFSPTIPLYVSVPRFVTRFFPRLSSFYRAKVKAPIRTYCLKSSNTALKKCLELEPAVDCTGKNHDQFQKSLIFP